MKLPWAGLSPQAKRGLLAHALHWQAVAIGSTYVAVYLFKLSGGYAVPAWHAFCSYFAIPLGYALAASLTRRHGAGASMRLGLAIYGGFQALILLLGPRSVEYAGALGFLWGLGVGLYWQAWVLLMIDLSEEGKDRDGLLASNQAMYFIANFSGAPLAGLFLARFSGVLGYPAVYAVGLALFALAWIVSLPLKGRPHHGSSALGRLLKIRKPRGWGAGLVSAGLMGVLSVGSMFLPQLLSFESGGNEGYGGGYAAFTALAGFAAAWAVARLGHPERRGGFLLASALGVAVLVLPLAFLRNYALLMFYGLGMAVALSVFNVPLFAAHISIVESSPRFRHRRADAMLLREIPLNVGRALACGLILWGVKDFRSGALSLLIGALALTPLANYWLLKAYLAPAPPRDV